MKNMNHAMTITDDLYDYHAELLKEKNYPGATALDIAIDFIDGIGKGTPWSERAPHILNALEIVESTATENEKMAYWYAIGLIKESLQ